MIDKVTKINWFCSKCGELRTVQLLPVKSVLKKKTHKYMNQIIKWKLVEHEWCAKCQGKILKDVWMRYILHACNVLMWISTDKTYMFHSCDDLAK